MKKQLPAFLTAFLLCMGAMPVSAADALTSTSGEYEGLIWTLADGVLTVSGEGKIAYDTGVPDGGSAESPGWYEYRSEITKLVITEGVTGADADAFRNYTALETVVLPEGFTVLSAGVFQNCTKLSEIQGLEHVQEFHRLCLNNTAMTAESPFVIVDGWLRYCDITETADIVVPDGVTGIGANIFGNLMEKTSEDTRFTVTLPDSVERIDAYAFANLPMLTKINLPAGITEIGAYAFLSCVRLDALTLGKNLQSVGDYAFFNCKELDTLTVLSETTQFGTMAYGILCDSSSCLMDMDPDCYTPESMAEALASDPYYYDPFVFCTVDWSGTGGYLWFDEAALMETLSPYLYTSPTAHVRSRTDAAARTHAAEAGVQFMDAEKLGDGNGDHTADAADAAVLLLSAANHGATGKSSLTAAQECALDVDGNGTMNAADAAWLLRYAAHTGGGGETSLLEFVYGE